MRECKFLIKAFSVFLVAMAMSVAASAGITWDLQSDYSTVSNPNGPWSYGWQPYAVVGGTYQPNGGFALYDTSSGTQWYASTHHSGDRTPSIWQNTGGWSYGIPPGGIAFHPGWDGSFSVAQWTAPFADTFSVSGSFGTGDYGSESYYVLVNGVPLYSWLNDPGAETFSFSTNLAAGDILAFAVGYNTYGGYGYGNTPVTATIYGTGIPEPSSLMLLGTGILGALGVVRRRFLP